MQHANALTFAALLPAVRPSMRLTRFLVITQDTISERFYLYGSTSSNEDALAASKAEHPFTLLVQELEYLPVERIAELRAQAAQDERAKALKNLGKQVLNA